MPSASAVNENEVVVDSSHAEPNILGEDIIVVDENNDHDGIEITHAYVVEDDEIIIMVQGVVSIICYVCLFASHHVFSNICIHELNTYFRFWKMVPLKIVLCNRFHDNRRHSCCYTLLCFVSRDYH